MCFFISNIYTSITRNHLKCILCFLRWTGCWSPVPHTMWPNTVVCSQLVPDAVESIRQELEVYVKMSACGEFAEHVWKPGSCKNCFHPRSAHGQTGTAGGACVRTSLIGEDEDGVTSPSPYSKPTIAVRPTMMNMDVTVEVKTDINMNTEQVTAGMHWITWIDELEKKWKCAENVLTVRPSLM